MLRRDASVVFMPSWLDACALWRLYMPYASYENTSFFVFKQPVFQLIVDKDIAVVQRCYSQGQFNFIAACKAAAMKVIVDLDDDVWHIPAHNPAYEMLSKCKDGFVHCMSLVDVITVSTKPLARIVAAMTKRMNIPIVVTENKINEKLFAVPRKNEQITVGWGGSNSHQGIPGQKGTGDLGIIEDAVGFLAEDYPKKVRFEFRGARPVDDVLRLENVHCYSGVPVAEYAARMPMWGWHIALAPVTMDEFNQSKSCIKMIEAAYCSIPCLATHIEAYDRFVSFDPELRWLLCVRQADWLKKLRALINEPIYCRELGARMKAVMAEHFSFRERHEGWDRAFATALNGK